MALSPERIAKIDTMSEAEMRSEIARGRFSRFNDESRRYMDGRLIQIAADKEHAAIEQQAVHIEETNERARTAGDANKKMLSLTTWSVVIVILGIAVSIAIFYYQR